MTDNGLAGSSAAVEIDSAKLREMRQDQGLTQLDLSAKCGLNASYLSQLETGARKRVSPPAFVRLCNALNIPASERGTLRLIRPKVA